MLGIPRAASQTKEIFVNKQEILHYYTRKNAKVYWAEVPANKEHVRHANSHLFIVAASPPTAYAQ